MYLQANGCVYIAIFSHMSPNPSLLLMAVNKHLLKCKATCVRSAKSKCGTVKRRSRAHSRHCGVLGQEQVIETRVAASMSSLLKWRQKPKKIIEAHLVGNRSLSGPLREMTKTMEPRPLMGARSLPVQKNRNFFFCSKLKECSTCHNKRIVGWPLK